MMAIDDETLIAFADGELDESRRAAVAEALLADPALRARLDAQRRLRARLAAHYAPAAEEPLPERLTALLTRGDDGGVADLAAGRQRRARPVWANFAAIAATLMIGLFAGTMIPRGSGPVAVEGGAMIARGDLADALETQLAAQGSDGPHRIGLSFEAADGRLCRTFEGDAMSGLACRGGEGWQLVMTAAGAGARSEYRQASSGNALVMQAAQELMAGEPLDAAGERQAREAGWRKSAARD